MSLSRKKLRYKCNKVLRFMAKMQSSFQTFKIYNQIIRFVKLMQSSPFMISIQFWFARAVTGSPVRSFYVPIPKPLYIIEKVFINMFSDLKHLKQCPQIIQGLTICFHENGISRGGIGGGVGGETGSLPLSRQDTCYSLTLDEVPTH